MACSLYHFITFFFRKVQSWFVRTSAENFGGSVLKDLKWLGPLVHYLLFSNTTTAVPDSTNRQYLSKSLWDGSCQELCPRLNSALHGFSYLVLSWSLTSKDPIRLVDFFFCQSERRQKLFLGHLILKIEIHLKSVYSNHLYNCVQISNLISTANFFQDWNNIKVCVWICVKNSKLSKTEKFSLNDFV